MHNETAFPETGYLRLTCPVTAVYPNDTPEKKIGQLLSQLSKAKNEIANIRRATQQSRALIQRYKSQSAVAAPHSIAALNAKLFNQVAGIAV